MTKNQAIEQVIKDAERIDPENILSSYEITKRALLLMNHASEYKKNLDSFNSLSARNTKLSMNPITTVNNLALPVCRQLVEFNIVEFLGEEYWLSLPNRAAKLVAVETYNRMRARLLRGMA